MSYRTITAGSPTVFNATLGFTHYYWDFGDGIAYYGGVAYGGSSLASHTYSRSGTYFVVLSGYNASSYNGFYSTASHVLTVGSGVVAADFVYPTTNVIVGAVYPSSGSPVVFNATVTGGTSPYAFSWDFGDGSTATGSTVTHVFSTGGTFTVVLTVTDAGGARAVASHYVVVQSAPRIDFSYPVVSVNSPVAFNATLGFTHYYWDFGDGTAYYGGVAYGGSNGAAHTYSRSGTYLVVLAGYNSTIGGGYSTTSHVLVVSSSAVAVDFSFPTSNIAIGPVTASAGSPVAFNVTSVQGGSPPYTFNWDFGDGSHAVGSSPTHTFASPGTYIVVLTVTDSGNAKATASHFVVVQSAPRLDFVSYPTVTAGSPTVFNATVIFPVYYWDFGDGTYSLGGVTYGGTSLASHTYSRSGTYFVILTAYNYTGVYPTASHVLVVVSSVVLADFVYPTRNDGLTVSVNAGSPVVFNATATGGSSPYQFAWTLGDGSTAVGQLPTHIFASPGSYIVVLTVTDSQDNVAVASHIVIVASSAYLVDFTYPQVAPGSIVKFSGTTGFYYYYWDFGDGSTYQEYGSNGASIAYHVYLSAGPFIVVMTVSDSLGTATASHGFSTALFSDFTVSPTSVAAGHPVSFNVTSVQGGTSPYSFAWTFGDGTTGSGTSPIHTYSKTGTFIIVLEITDSSTPSANSLTIAHSITVVDFEITATPTVLYAIPGQSSNSTISVTSKLGFTGPVVLTAVISPQPGLTCTITPGTVNLGTSEIAVLSCQGSVVTPFTVTVTGSASSSTHSLTITFYVTDFSIGASPTTITFDNDSSGDSTVYVSSIDGFSEPVALSSTVSPSGLACTIVPDIVTPSGYYYTTSALNCSSSIAGTYSLNVTGSSASLTHSVMLTFKVLLINFDISASPNTLTIVSGSSANSTIILGVINGFTGIVAVSAAIYPPGPIVSLLDSSLTLGATNSTVLTVSTGLGGAGDYTVTVTGVSGQLSHTVTIIVHIQDFAISASQVTIEPATSGTTNIVVYSANGFTGNVTLTATSSQGSANGITLSLSTENVIVPSGSTGYSTLTITTLTSTPSGLYNITIMGNFGTLSHTIILTIQVSTPAPDFTINANPAVITANVGTIANSTITIFPLNGFTDVVTLSTVISPGSGLSCALIPGMIAGGSGSSTLSCAESLGSYVVTVTGTSGALSHYATVYFTFTAQDFTVNASPTSVFVNVGQAGNSTIIISAANGFADVVNLTVDTSGCILDPTSVIGSGASKLSCTFATAGSFTVNVTGTSPSLSHSVTINYSVGVPDFTITSNPITIAVNAGIAVQSIITVSQINGFTGNVTLIIGISPSTGGLTCTLTVTSVLLGASGTSSLSCYGSAGVYTVTVTGTIDLLSHSATVIYTVQDFRISANPSSVNADVNQTATSTITITALDFFHGIVTLTDGNAACTLTPDIITGSGTSMLSCTFTSVGTFNVVVNGTSQTLSRSITVTYIVAVSGFTTTGISCDTTVVVNQASLCTATVTDTTTTGATSPTGTVTFALNPSPGGGTFDSSTCTLVVGAAGVSSCSVHFTGSGPGGDVVNLVASYPGDTTHASSSSMVVSFGILGRSTTTTITCDSPVIVVTQSLCHVITTDISPGTPITPTGDFSLATSSSGTFDHNCMLDGTGATATCTVTYTPTVTGHHTITATYPQNNVDSYNTPGTFVITVNPPVLHTTTTTVVCTPSTKVLLGQNFGCTATVTDQSTSPTTPTGTVTFTGGATCSLGGNAETATCTGTLAGQTIGPLSITANYPGDIDHAASSGTTSVTIVARPTTTTLTCLPASVDIGTATSCTATVTDSSGIGTAITPTGTVDFTTNATGTFATLPCTLAEGTTAGIASCSVSYTPSGTTARTDMITATYVTDTSHTASSDAFSLAVTMPVQAHQTSTSISCVPNTVVINQVTSCTATVTDTSVAPTNPTGNVSFSSDSTGSFIPDTANCTLTPFGANVASCSISYVPSAVGTGTHTISATYSGDSSQVSSLGQTTVTVNKRATSTTITSCAPASINFGSATLCTALVNDTDIGIGIIPTGTVAFTSSGPGTFIGSPCTVSQQVATCQVTYTPTGTTARTDTITAIYSGDASHDTSTGTFPVNVETIPLDTTTTTVSCTPNPVTIGQLSTCTATVTDTVTAPTTPTGTVSFTAGDVCTLAGVNASSATCSISTVPVASGTIAVSALYSGDPTHSTSIGNTGLATSLRMPTVTVACAPASVAVNQATTCTVTVADQAPGTASTPTGTVTFAPGGTCTLSHSSSDPNPESTCTVTITPTATGQLSVSAKYSGDSIHFGSQGSTTVNVTPAILNSTSTSISCIPNNATVSSLTTCTATVTDTSSSGATTPTGTVGFTTNSTGTFAPTSTTCTLAAGSTAATTSCSVSYTPTVAGHHLITGSYSGDPTHSGSTGSFNLAVSSTAPPSLHSTKTLVSCSQGSVLVNAPTTCTAKVTDNSTSPTVPTGTVTFTTNAAGTFSPASATCTLVAGNAPKIATCSVSYSPTVTGKQPITGSYNGDSSHAKSSGGFTVNVRSTLSGSVLLTFNGYDLGNIDNGLSQLAVLVNGQLAMDVPASLDHLTGTEF